MEGNIGKEDHAPESFRSNTEEEYEMEELKKSFDEDFEMFLLNNILMTAQFFENYERDMETERNEGTTKDMDNFTIFQADTLHELVARKVLFHKKSETENHVTESIHPLRTYVSYKYVELDKDSSSFNKLKPSGAPYYELILQGCDNDTKEDSGYFNLILSQETEDLVPSTLIRHPDNPKKVIKSNASLTKNDQFYYLEPDKRSKPYPVESYRTNEKLGFSGSLPKSCFKEIDKRSQITDKRRMGKTTWEDLSRKIKPVNKLLSSAAFKRHFTEVFLQRLWNKMNFGSVETDSVLFDRDHLSIVKKSVTHHVIPVLETESYDINIPGFDGKNTGWIEWPTRRMREVIERTKCHLLPEGYYETSDTNNEDTDYTLEWKVIFPKAERYLLSHLMHTHTKCYLFTLLLYKSFIETNRCFVHFGPSHILNLLFLKVQKDFYGWPEYNQGRTLLKFLKVLESTIQKKSLKCFFLPQRNLYANSSAKYLNRAQTLLSRIAHNPIPFILKALTNLKYAENFYPMIDYLRLYNILTVEDLKEYLNPTPQKKVKRNKGIEIEAQKIGKESINEDEPFQVKRTPFRECQILCFFIHHFIAIAKKSLEYEGTDYAMLYLVHAKRLLIILSHKSQTSDYFELTQSLTKSMNSIAEALKKKKQNSYDV